MKFHKAFQLNGRSFSNSEELLSYAGQLSEELYSFLQDWLNESSELKVMTSGSTGTPKEIFLQKNHMKNSAKATGHFFELGEHTKALLCLSPKYIAGKMMMVRAMELGWHLEVVKESSAPLEKLEKDFDFVAMVPLQLSNSLSDLHRIKTVIVGGAPVSPSLLQELKGGSCEVYATYGTTETTSHVALKRLNHCENENEAYLVLPEVTIAADSRGCLVIDAKKVASETIITNDLVKIVGRDAFHWLGRYDTVVNSGGVKLIPEQIELKLSKIIPKRFFLAGLPHSQLGQKLVLLIEGEGESILESKDVKVFLQNAALSKYEYPKEVYFVRKFKETKTKKIDRRSTLEMI